MEKLTDIFETIGLGPLADALGALFVLAVILEFLAVFVRHCASRKPEEDEEEKLNAGLVILNAVTSFTPGVLLIHAVYRGVVEGRGEIVVAILLIIGASGAGLVLGRIVAAIWPGLRTLKPLAAAVGVLAFGVAIAASLESLKAILKLLGWNA